MELTSRKFQILVKRFVIIKRSDDDQELKETMFKISDLKIPYQRAIWFLKMNQIANPPLTLSLKSKRSSSELYSSGIFYPFFNIKTAYYTCILDLSQFAVRFLSELISNAENEIGGKNTMVQHWLFFTNLFKNLFEVTH